MTLSRVFRLCVVPSGESDAIISVDCGCFGSPAPVPSPNMQPAGSTMVPVPSPSVQWLTAQPQATPPVSKKKSHVDEIVYTPHTKRVVSPIPAQPFRGYNVRSRRALHFRASEEDHTFDGRVKARNRCVNTTSTAKGGLRSTRSQLHSSSCGPYWTL